jgi:hypothetical protein
MRRDFPTPEQIANQSVQLARYAKSRNALSGVIKEARVFKICKFHEGIAGPPQLL